MPPPYDPERRLSPEAWLALDEAEQVDAVLEYHRKAGTKLPSEMVHAALHAAVESQIAMGDELPVRATLQRLLAEGLDRHDAIHAIASVLTIHIHDLLDPTTATPAGGNESYYRALRKLTAKSWRASAAG